MRAALSVALALLLAACSNSAGPGHGLRVQTSASAYGLIPVQPTPPVTVPFTVRNTGSHTLALPNCGAGVLGELQKREEGAWVTVASGLCPAFELYAPVVLAPGQSSQGNVTVATIGRYRVRVAVSEGVGDDLAYSAVSGEFEARWLED